ncbi:hypothetical protein [Gordonia alkaliphila]|uniref:Uncharacterized protein n=1 Tax=Gordonia alkaliphila TaxID=1053547 RepID=A0ABP8ZL78_9ACTN
MFGHTLIRAVRSGEPGGSARSADSFAYEDVSWMMFIACWPAGLLGLVTGSNDDADPLSRPFWIIVAGAACVPAYMALQVLRRKPYEGRRGAVVLTVPPRV